MSQWSYFALALFLVSSPPDVPHGAAPLRSDANAIPSGITLPTLSDIFLSVSGRGDARQSSLQLRERLEIVRFLDKEFARVVRPLPVEKSGFKYSPRAPLDESKLSHAISSHAPAANPGDTVQITDIRFEQNEIVVEINGGAKGHWRPFEHLHGGISAGGSPPAQTPTPATPSTPQAQRGVGATLVLEYGQALPDMGPDDLKRDLSAFLSFADQHSVAVAWVDTLPPEFRNAIKERRALVGMNADMVIAAMGRPDQKVRETTDAGDETEDWIYGRPPGKTIFVTFLNSKVTRIEQFP